MTNYPYVSINGFLGLSKTTDILSLPPGKLIQNKNYLYDENRELYERGGGAKLTNAPSSGNPLLGLGNYKNNAGSEFLVCAQGTDLYYYDSGWQSLSLTLTSGKRTRFEAAGYSTGRALYACNGFDGVKKISGTTPTAGAVSSSPNVTFMKLHKNRLFGTDGLDTIYFTDVNAFDTWNTGSNFNRIDPGNNGFLQGMEIWGDSLFIFKQDAIYVLPNADSSPSDWVFLRADAEVGTHSPDSIIRTKIGIFYFGSDFTIRRISPDVTFSSGNYTLGGSGSPKVSIEIQNDIEDLFDATYVTSVAASYHNNLYIISMQSVNNSGTYNDKTYFADTTKLIQVPNTSDVQPMWGELTGYDYNLFAVQTLGGLEQLYGAKGSSGQVHSLLDNSIHNDDGSAIDSVATLAWFSIGTDGTMKRLKLADIVAYVEDWPISIKINSYQNHGVVPNLGEGVSRTFLANESNVAIVGSGIVGTDVVGDYNITTRQFRHNLNLRGYYFTIEFENSNVDQFTKIAKCLIYFEPMYQN